MSINVVEKIDEYVKDYNKMFGENFNLNKYGGYDAYYIDVSNGKADLALECTRKGNLEIAIAHGLITESGGVMTTLNGEKIDSKKRRIGKSRETRNI